MSNVHSANVVGRLNPVKATGAKMEVSITRPDDWHLHLRDGDLLEAVISHRSFCQSRTVFAFLPLVRGIFFLNSFRFFIVKSFNMCCIFRFIMATVPSILEGE